MAYIPNAGMYYAASLAARQYSVNQFPKGLEYFYGENGRPQNYAKALGCFRHASNNGSKGGRFMHRGATSTDSE
ncbi:MAG: hypothetical protein LUD72_10640 [Bacteroidales bacterium]|nr:hypothetical protein [Bacteroidales bacterium]